MLEFLEPYLLHSSLDCHLVFEVFVGGTVMSHKTFPVP